MTDIVNSIACSGCYRLYHVIAEESISSDAHEHLDNDHLSYIAIATQTSTKYGPCGKNISIFLTILPIDNSTQNIKRLQLKS